MQQRSLPTYRYTSTRCYVCQFVHRKISTLTFGTNHVCLLSSPSIKTRMMSVWQQLVAPNKSDWQEPRNVTANWITRNKCDKQTFKKLDDFTQLLHVTHFLPASCCTCTVSQYHVLQSQIKPHWYYKTHRNAKHIQPTASFWAVCMLTSLQSKCLLAKTNCCIHLGLKIIHYPKINTKEALI